jgi:hypothetical protein
MISWSFTLDVRTITHCVLMPLSPLQVSLAVFYLQVSGLNHCYVSLISCMSAACRILLDLITRI